MPNNHCQRAIVEVSGKKRTLHCESSKHQKEGSVQIAVGQSVSDLSQNLKITFWSTWFLDRLSTWKPTAMRTHEILAFLLLLLLLLLFLLVCFLQLNYRFLYCKIRGRRAHTVDKAVLENTKSHFFFKFTIRAYTQHPELKNMHGYLSLYIVFSPKLAY